MVSLMSFVLNLIPSTVAEAETYTLTLMALKDGWYTDDVTPWASISAYNGPGGIDNCLVSHNSVSLIEALNLLFNLQIDSNRSIINNNFTRLVVVVSEDKESNKEFFAKGFVETLTLLKEQFKVPAVVEDSYNKTSDNWIIKLDNNYKEAYDGYIKSIMIENKPSTSKSKRTRRKKSNANNL